MDQKPPSIDFENGFCMSIDGLKVICDKGIDVINPATEQLVGVAPDCSAEMLDEAVNAARKAFPEWRSATHETRANALELIAEKLEENVEPLGVLLTREQGKPLADARMEIARSALWFRHFAKCQLSIEHRISPEGRKVEIRRVPVGVVGAITPWNFPINLATWKLAPALLAGNTVVLKPSPFTPLTTLKIGELLLDVLPPGVLNVVSGGDHLGPRMSEHLGLDKIAFTGSTATGRAVMRSASVNLKRVTLELGGNDPAIVLPDVDVEETAEKMFWAAFRNCGQVCVAAKRIYVHDAIYDQFAAAMANLARTFQPSNGEAPGARIGPVQNRVQYQRVQELIEDSRRAGYKFLSEPGDMKGPGYFIAPTIIDNPPDDSRIVLEEPFGPVVPLLRFSDIDDVIRRANDSEFGLSGSVWSKNVEVARSIATRLDCGTVWINAAQVLMPSVPFGGRKQSGVGVENGDEGLCEFTSLHVTVE
ncbi:aldehyde dehydrogenase family protein [Ferribacterium limneticum]|uniref:aldehyde dehydrogenase family protein n=1 Tax=Ferribacterium limneticum TaxID=76259 RepID=UPI001CFB569A|nr:aldehyde dehydrogenase family protein [Ferribacterium limneticum]UCV17762.1 aldehyde dehydrogenase family protein [Ferribacterium limneticum]